MNIINNKERGQVIYLLAVGIITLLGFTALAIDGARLFSERRNAQGVADTAAFTAAAYVGQYELAYLQSNWYGGTKVEPHAEQAALDRIRSNGYDDASYNPFGSDDRLRITIDPVSETLGTKYIVRVFLISEVDPIFAQLVFNGPLLVNVESQAIVRPRTNVGFGQAMYSLSDHTCKAISFSGNSAVEINVTGIYASSDCQPDAIDFGGTAGVYIEDNITTPGGINDHGSGGYTSGGDVEGVPQQPFPKVPTPDCTGLPVNPPVVTVASKSYLFSPGIYTYQIMSNNNEFNDFQPGMYCLQLGLKINGGEVSGNDVMFYVPHENVAITGGIVSLTAPTGGQADDNENTWDGMLFFVEEGKVDITGGVGTYLEGTVYAPGPEDPTCKLTGNGDTEGYNLQMVCNTISLIGGAGLTIDFDNSNAYVPPVSIDLVQ